MPRRRSASSAANLPIIGRPRMHTNPQVLYEHCENILAQQQYTSNSQLVTALAHLGFTSSLTRAKTSVRTHGGVVLSTRFGNTSTPTGYEILLDLSRRRRIIQSTYRNAAGELDYDTRNRRILDRGLTPAQRIIERNEHEWMVEVTKYGDRRARARNLS